MTIDKRVASEMDLQRKVACLLLVNNQLVRKTLYRFNDALLLSASILLNATVFCLRPPIYSGVKTPATDELRRGALVCIWPLYDTEN